MGNKGVAKPSRVVSFATLVGDMNLSLVSSVSRSVGGDDGMATGCGRVFSADSLCRFIAGIC